MRMTEKDATDVFPLEDIITVLNMPCCILHRLGKVPSGLSYEGWATDSLGEEGMRYIEACEVDEAWYWYEGGGYDGSGQLLMRKANEYDAHDMGHCSCYGPTEYVQFTGRYKSLDEIEQKCSAEAWKALAPLVAMARCHMRSNKTLA